jgi:Mg2+-importing ATPase
LRDGQQQFIPAEEMTFGVLQLILHATQDLFRSGWLVESVVTELLILLVMRTRRPFFKSKPSGALAAATLAIVVVTLVLPYSPLKGLPGFTPMPVPFLLALLGITVLYIVTSEVAKYIFCKRARA